MNKFFVTILLLYKILWYFSELSSVWFDKFIEELEVKNRILSKQNQIKVVYFVHAKYESTMHGLFEKTNCLIVWPTSGL